VEKTAATTESPSGSRVTVAPSTPIIGAEIAGVDLREPESSELSAGFRRLLAQHKVLFFRDQELNTAQHVSFARSFGSILTFSGAREDHPEYPGVQIVPGKTSLPRSDGGRETGMWHIDASSIVVAPFATIVRAVVIPPVGGDTIWANLAAAYEGLSDELKQKIDGLYLTHGSTEHLRQRGADYPLLSRPIVRTHPETGEKVLHIDLLFHPLIIGWNPRESDQLVQKLTEEATRPEYRVRFRWSPGAIAVWDNRAVHHYAVYDYGDFPRRMERILVAEPTLPLVEQLI
jgi:alpha-ketoglutarate-dependent taurine dioxygenase